MLLSEGETIAVTVELENIGESELQRTLPLAVGEQQLDTAPVALASGESTTIELTGTPEETGTQNVEVGTHQVGAIVVRAAKPDTVRDVDAHYYPWYGEALQIRGMAWIRSSY